MNSWLVLHMPEVYMVAVFAFLITVLSVNGPWCCVSFLRWDDNLSETRISPDCYGNNRVASSSLSAPQLQWAYGYESGSDSDVDRPDPDLVLDDLASRRFHSPSPALPTNFAVPISPLAGGRLPGSKGDPWPKVTVTPSVAPQQNVTCHRSEHTKLKCDVPA